MDGLTALHSLLATLLAVAAFCGYIFKSGQWKASVDAKLVEHERLLAKGEDKFKQIMQGIEDIRKEIAEIRHCMGRMDERLMNLERERDRRED